MKTKLFLLVIFSAFALLGADLYFDGTCDKDPLSYKSGEEMTFTITLKNKKNNDAPVTGRRVKWQRRGDDKLTESGFADTDKPLVLKTKINQPGFVRITVELLDENGKPVKKRNSKYEGGAGADVKQLTMTNKPADFDKFWNGEYKKLIDTPYKVKITEKKSANAKLKLFKFSISTLPGYIDATGYILIPKNAKPKSLSICAMFSGYGFGKTYTSYVKDNIMVIVTRHGEEPDREPQYYKDLQNGSCKGFCFRNNQDLYKNDFYNMIIRGQRALQYAETLPEWNGKSITVQGGSMGGFQALAAAALNKKVTKCIARVPWVADLEGYIKHNRQRGWRPDWVEQLGYIDSVNLASRITCPTQVELGLGDYVCPPSGGMLLYRNLKGEKSLLLRQNCGHSTSPLTPKPINYTYAGELK